RAGRGCRRSHAFSSRVAVILRLIAVVCWTCNSRFAVSTDPSNRSSSFEHSPTSRALQDRARSASHFARADLLQGFNPLNDTGLLRTCGQQARHP
ncbi:uncharacterized protein B0H18DRAFT_998717, partial [Fomitopsis serialis]|uniref:uncharacterized protein n=1 Tax=Fomitopsis serialis TaxID=139415 RepID=UPI0020080033